MFPQRLQQPSHILLTGAPERAFNQTTWDTGECGLKKLPTAPGSSWMMLFSFFLSWYREEVRKRKRRGRGCGTTGVIEKERDKKEKALSRKAGVHPWAKMGGCFAGGRETVFPGQAEHTWHSRLRIKQLIFERLSLVSKIHTPECVCACLCMCVCVWWGRRCYIIGSSAVGIKR